MWAVELAAGLQDASSAYIVIPAFISLVRGPERNVHAMRVASRQRLYALHRNQRPYYAFCGLATAMPKLCAPRELYARRVIVFGMMCVVYASRQ